MDMRPLGSTGVRVSVLGLGTVKLGRSAGVKYPAPFAIPSDDEARELLHAAADLGINLVDTAPAYGVSEERLGGLLRGWRERWVISTKVGEEFGGAASRYDFSPEAVKRSVERSLARLGVERLDIVLVHSDGRDVEIIERMGTLEALRDMQRRGVIGAVGMSTKTADGALLAVERSDVVMVTLNRGYDGDRPAIRLAHERGVGVLVKKALESGHGASAVEDALALCLGEPGVSSVVVGTINPEHVRANALAAAQILGR